MKLYKIKFDIKGVLHEGVVFADTDIDAKNEAVKLFPLYTLENIISCEDQSEPI